MSFTLSSIGWHLALGKIFTECSIKNTRQKDRCRCFVYRGTRQTLVECIWGVWQVYVALGKESVSSNDLFLPTLLIIFFIAFDRSLLDLILALVCVWKRGWNFGRRDVHLQEDVHGRLCPTLYAPDRHDTRSGKRMHETYLQVLVNAGSRMHAWSQAALSLHRHKSQHAWLVVAVRWIHMHAYIWYLDVSPAVLFIVMLLLICYYIQHACFFTAGVYQLSTTCLLVK
jgi:hypothetical protein